MTKRCGRCKHFLAATYRHRYCLSCTRKIKKLARAGLAPTPVKEIIKAPQYAPMADPTKPEVYLGKKQPCSLCEEVTHLFSHPKFKRGICGECRDGFVKRMRFL